jgi:HTH-type transcriptional regulator/antitoxin HigA
MTNERMAGEVFAPGEFLKEELEARGWTQVELAEILGRPPRLINEIIAGKRAITPETAKGLAEALGTSAELWMNLESAYQLHQVKLDTSVARRAKLHSIVPIKDMVRRNWIEPSDNVEVLEQRVFSFFGIKNLDEKPTFWNAARKSTSYQETGPAELAWLFRARQLAHAVQVAAFTAGALDRCLVRLKGLLQEPAETRHVPKILAESGIRFIVLEQLPHTRIDGVCFWLDEKSPVIALSFRFDRIDCFWHTLLHEIRHVEKFHGLKDDGMLDRDICGENATPMNERPEIEREVDSLAAEFLIPQGELKNFIGRVRPFYYKKKIIGFARHIGVHPGLVVGQLQYRGEITYAHNREMLTKVRRAITESALTDGWGNAPSLG